MHQCALFMLFPHCLVLEISQTYIISRGSFRRVLAVSIGIVLASPDESAFVSHRKCFRKHLKALSFFDCFRESKGSFTDYVGIILRRPEGM